MKRPLGTRDLRHYTPAQLARREQLLAPIMCRLIERKSWAGLLIREVDIPGLTGQHRKSGPEDAFNGLNFDCPEEL